MVFFHSHSRLTYLNFNLNHQVCNAVNSPKKLLFEVIGDEYDDFADKMADGKLMDKLFIIHCISLFDIANHLL